MKLFGPILYAWLAALIDGEGSIMLTRRAHSLKQPVMRQVHYRATISIATTDMRLMYALRQNTGISRIYRHRINGDPRAPQKRAQYTWRLANDDIRLWLPKVRPYLVLKGKQADLLLEALAIKAYITPGSVGFLPKNRVKQIARLHKIYAKIRQLNQRGRVVLIQEIVDAV